MLNQNYQQLILELLPPGLAWNRSPDSKLSLIIGELARSFALVHELSDKIPRDVNPLYTEHYLDEWEEALGTKLDCKEIDSTFQGRKAAVISKLRSIGGSSIGYLEDVARALGYPVTITDGFAPFKVGSSKVGDHLSGDDWASVFQVRGPEQVTRPFKVGQSKVGEPLVVYGSGLLECTINRIKPAGTIALFAYYNVIQKLIAKGTVNISATATMRVIRHLSASGSIDISARVLSLWNPSQLLGLVSWLRGNDLDSGDIEEWVDRSPLGNDATNSDSGTQPVAVPDAINYRTAARFSAGDKLQIFFNQDLEVTKNLDIFMAGTFTASGTFLTRSQYEVDIGSTVEARALTKNWQGRAFGATVLGSNGNFCIRFQGNLYLGTWFGLFKSTNNGTSFTEVLSGSDHIYCRGLHGGFLIYDDELWISSGTVNRMYRYDGTTVTEWSLSGISQSGASLDPITVYDGEVHVGDTAHRRVFKFNGSTWESIGDAGSTNGLFGLCADGTYLYACVQAAGNSGIYKWDGASWTTVTTLIMNPRVIFVAQGVLWAVADSALYNATVGWTSPLTLSGVQYPGHYCFLNEGNSVLILDVGGTQSVRYDFSGTTLSSSLIKGKYGGLGNDGNAFHDSSIDPHEILLGKYGLLRPYRLAQNSYTNYATSIPTLGIFHFNFYDTDMTIRINGAIVTQMRFDSAFDSELGNEDYRSEKLLQEAIDITGGLVSLVGNIITIDPTSDFPENTVIEIIAPNTVVDDWAGVDDWNFRTGVVS